MDYSRVMKKRVGIVGAATDAMSLNNKITAELVGKLIASNGFEVATGAARGAPHLALLKAKENGSKTIGFSPDSNTLAHNNRPDTAPLGDFHKVRFIEGFTKRSLAFISSCDVIIVLGGRMGTLSEYAIAFEENKPIGVLTTTGGIARHLKDITRFCNKHRETPVFFSDDAESLFRLIVGYFNRNQWQNLAKDYRNACTLSDEKGYSAVINLTKAGLKDANVLDYGCGVGKFSKRLKKFRPKRIFAVDNSSQAISLASKSRKISYKHIKNADLAHIKDNSLDFAFINYVLCCVQSSQDIKKILKEVNTKLKKNGKLIILDPHPKSVGCSFESLKREKPVKLVNGTPVKVILKGMNKGFYDFWHPLREYKKLVKESGFILSNIIEPSKSSIILKAKKF